MAGGFLGIRRSPQRTLGPTRGPHSPGIHILCATVLSGEPDAKRSHGVGPIWVKVACPFQGRIWRIAGRFGPRSSSVAPTLGPARPEVGRHCPIGGPHLAEVWPRPKSAQPLSIPGQTRPRSIGVAPNLVGELPSRAKCGPKSTDVGRIRRTTLGRCGQLRARVRDRATNIL